MIPSLGSALVAASEATYCSALFTRPRAQQQATSSALPRPRRPLPAREGESHKRAWPLAASPRAVLRMAWRQMLGSSAPPTMSRSSHWYASCR